MLKGVGDYTADHWQTGHLAIHYRRAMTLAEALRLPTAHHMTEAEKRAVWENIREKIGP
jgi:hypothetical protein